MTLTEKIVQANKLATEIKKTNPEVSSMWFEFDNIPVVEIQERAQKLGRAYEIVWRNEKDVLQLNAADSYQSFIVVFAYSVPVKKTKPEFIIEA